MAGWNDMPTEVKERIVSAVEEDEESADSQERQTFIALSSTSRELYTLSGPILWQSLKFKLSKRTSDELEFLASSIAPRRARYLERIDVEGELESLEDVQKAAQTCAKAFALATSVKHFYMSQCSAFAAAVVGLLPEPWRQRIYAVYLSGSELPGSLDGFSAAMILGHFPQVKALLLSNVSADGSASLISTLQNSSLEALALNSVAGLDHPTLSDAWSCPLSDLELDQRISTPLLFSTLSVLSSTLSSLELPLLSPTPTTGMPPLFLPHLQALKLTLAAPSADLVSAFATSPLQSLTVTLVGDTRDVRIAGIQTYEVVKACKDTLRNVLVEIKVTGLDEAADRPMSQIDRFCEEEGIEVKIDWQGGDSDEEEEDRF